MIIDHKVAIGDGGVGLRSLQVSAVMHVSIMLSSMYNSGIQAFFSNLNRSKLWKFYHSGK